MLVYNTQIVIVFPVKTFLRCRDYDNITVVIHFIQIYCCWATKKEQNIHTTCGPKVKVIQLAIHESLGQILSNYKMRVMRKQTISCWSSSSEKRNLEVLGKNDFVCLSAWMWHFVLRLLDRQNMCLSRCSSLVSQSFTSAHYLLKTTIKYVRVCWIRFSVVSVKLYYNFYTFYKLTASFRFKMIPIKSTAKDLQSWIDTRRCYW